MGWVERKRRRHCCKPPILWWWGNIGHGSMWECPRCDTRWIVGGISMRYWTKDVRLWSNHRW